jgi:hypothetical protein
MGRAVFPSKALSSFLREDFFKAFKVKLILNGEKWFENDL